MLSECMNERFDHSSLVEQEKETQGLTMKSNGSPIKQELHRGPEHINEIHCSPVHKNQNVSKGLVAWFFAAFYL